MLYTDPSGHKECEDAFDCEEIPESDSPTESYDKILDTLSTLPQDTAQNILESLQKTHEQLTEMIENTVGRRVHYYPRSDHQILSDDMAVVGNVDFQIAVPGIESLSYKIGLEMTVHNSGSSLQLVQTGTNQMYAAGVGIDASGALIFNANNLDAVDMVDQAFTVNAAVGGGATFSYLSSSSAPTPGGDEPWGVGIGPGAGVKFALGLEQEISSHEIYRYLPR